MLVLRGEFGLAKKPRSTFDNSPALPESLPDFNGCPSVNHADTRAEWKNIYAKEKRLVTSFNKAYVTQNASEYFAESYRDYVLNKNTLRSSRPLTFQYIEKALSDLHDMPESRFARMHDSYAKAGIWKN